MSFIIKYGENIERFGLSKGHFSLYDFHAWDACKGQNSTNNYQYGQRGPSFADKTSSVSLIVKHTSYLSIFVRACLRSIPMTFYP